MSCEINSAHADEHDVRRVYVVDDDSAVRRSIWILLTTAGYEPRPFINGTEFLAEAPTLWPGVVLLDIRMPELDGLAVLERLSATARNQLPVIMITGHGDLPSAVRAMKAGARDFLEKPFKEEALLEILDNAFVGLKASEAEQARRVELRARVGRLTGREMEVLRALAKGDLNKVVAYQLGLSVRTIEMHRAKLLERLGIRTLAEAVRLCFEAGVTL